ncbi:hypothetical protein ZEAMMB73_Zm00001d010768 [Zea mays]|uniref:Protein kinase domain-containing protein n=1 Tax=Zea mays TaxID=4577 RepID=A0A1D6FTI6_MAIZE|nr:hypothetical protein ZEAMMB73_Zm00001d010768 [Zea mays]
MGEGTFECVLECWDRETREYVAIKVVRGIHKYCDAAMVEIDVLNRLAENEKYRSLLLYVLQVSRSSLDPLSSVCLDMTLSCTFQCKSHYEEKELNIPVIKENGKDDGKEDQRSEEKAVAAASKSSLGLEKKARMSMSLMILMRVSDYLLKKAML